MKDCTTGDHSSTGDHPSAEAIAILVERGSDRDQDAWLVDHLAACSRCFGVYAELMRHRMVGSVSPPMADPRLVELGMKIGEDPSVRGVSRRSAWSWRDRLFPGAVMATMAVSLAVVFFRPPTPATIDEELLRTLITAIEYRSSGPLVFPGGEAGAASSPQRFRSGPHDLSLQSALDALLPVYLDGEPTEEVAFWLAAGYLANDQVENAAIYLRDATRRFPRSERLEILQAILAYRTDLDESTRILRRIVARSPENAVASFDLGRLLVERGDPEGLELLESVRTRFRNQPIGLRAATEIQRYIALQTGTSSH